MKEEATEYFIMQKDMEAYTGFLTSNLSFVNNTENILSFQSWTLYSKRKAF